MTAATVIVAGRRAAEAAMASTCSILRVQNGTWDEDLGDYVDVTATIYTGPCRLKSAMSRVTEETTEGQVLAAQQVILYLPIDGTAAVHIDDRVHILDGGPDPALTGANYRVKGTFTQTWATARRIPIESLT